MFFSQFLFKFSTISLLLSWIVMALVSTPVMARIREISWIKITADHPCGAGALSAGTAFQPISRSSSRYANARQERCTTCTRSLVSAPEKYDGRECRVRRSGRMWYGGKILSGRTGRNSNGRWTSSLHVACCLTRRESGAVPHVIVVSSLHQSPNSAIRSPSTLLFDYGSEPQRQ